MRKKTFFCGEHHTPDRCRCRYNEHIGYLPFRQSRKEESGGHTISRARHTGEYTIGRAIRERRSVRKYRNVPLELADTGQILRAAPGITGTPHYRSAPSAGALYPLEV